MSRLLDEIVANKRLEVAERKRHVTEEALSARLAQEESLNGYPFLSAIQSPGLKLILEIKPASPSAGVLAEEFNLDERLDAYGPYASALSVLTDAKYFKGSLALLEEISGKFPHPLLCKDFIIDPYQLLEARLAGASAVLLIVKILDDATLRELHAQCLALGMTPVVEIQNETELERSFVLNPQVLLINNRNLENFSIEFETTEHLAPKVPKDITLISASGIERSEDIERLKPFANVFLIGSSLMKLQAGEAVETLKTWRSIVV
jgi:indole-3-glycerol phosphate synthase